MDGEHEGGREEEEHRGEPVDADPVVFRSTNAFSAFLKRNDCESHFRKSEMRRLGKNSTYGSGMRRRRS